MNKKDIVGKKTHSLFILFKVEKRRGVSKKEQLKSKQNFIKREEEEYL